MNVCMENKNGVKMGGHKHTIAPPVKKVGGGHMPPLPPPRFLRQWYVWMDIDTFMYATVYLHICILNVCIYVCTYSIYVSVHT